MDVVFNDKERQRNMEAKGIAVLRFTNDEIIKKLETVIIKIKEFINSSKNQHADERSKKLL